MKQESSIAINEPALLHLYPQLRNIPKDHLQIVVYTIAGLTPTAIAEAVSVTRPTVYNVIEKYNIKSIINDSIGLQRMLLSNSIGTMAVEAMAALALKKSDLKSMTATQLIIFIKECLTLADSIRPKNIEPKKSADELISGLKAEEDGKDS